jgi:hypothetical protein
LLQWRPPGWYGVSSRPMAASSGLRCSPVDMLHRVIPRESLQHVGMTI